LIKNPKNGGKKRKGRGIISVCKTIIISSLALIPFKEEPPIRNKEMYPKVLMGLTRKGE